MSKQRIFETHGVVFSGESGDQLIGRCPFTDKENKFYVNRRNWLWDSKTAGLSGNISTFLKLTSQRYQDDMPSGGLRELSRHRELPVEAFADWPIGFDVVNRAYTMPVQDIDGNYVDIRSYRLGGRVMSTPGVQVGLLNAHLLPTDVAANVYICEGEWDAVSCRWMLKKAKKPGLVVAVPGAGTFKPEWATGFSGRSYVYSVYDNDEAGEQGEHILLRRILLSVKHLMFVHWPQDLPGGFDMRDWVIAHADKGMNVAYDNLHKLFSAYPRTKVMPKPGMEGGPRDEPDRRGTMTPASQNGNSPSKWKTPPSLDEVMGVFKKWLHLESVDAIKIMLACVVSQSMDGPPVWVFLVGPPGSAKTAILASLNTFSKIYSTSSLTVHALISGANWKESMDPSLIPKLNGKIMVVKDFTSILSMRDTEKEEIFGILRDAYDGKCGKVFGNGVERNYVSRFTVLAAVTPRIYDMSSQHTALGERFLKYAVGDNLKHTAEKDIISRAIQNINSEAKMNEEFQDAVSAFLDRSVRLNAVPTIADSIEKQIIALAMFGARLRGSVSRDTYRNEIMTSRPSAEIGSRLGIQLAKLAKSLAMVQGRKAVNADDVRLLKKVTLDTIPQRNEDLFRHMLRLCQTPQSTVTTATLSSITRYPMATVSRLLQDMDVLDIVVKKGTYMKHEWAISKYIRDCVATAGLYQTEEELNRPTRMFIRVKRKE